MIYSIGDVVDTRSLHWSSDWNSDEILGEDYPREFVIGLYSSPELDSEGFENSYYIDMETNVVIAVFKEKEDLEDVETIWNEGYLEC